MSTRSVIRFKNDEVGTMIYKHWDGYPSATIPWLCTKIKEFTEVRKNDYSYFFAYVLKNIFNDAKEFGLDDSKFTGWGLLKHDDRAARSLGVDYVYTVDLENKTIAINNRKIMISADMIPDTKFLLKLER